MIYLLETVKLSIFCLTAFSPRVFNYSFVCTNLPIQLFIIAYIFLSFYWYFFPKWFQKKYRYNNTNNLINRN